MRKKNEISVGEAIDAYLDSIGMKEKALVQRVIADWETIMGKPIAENTEKVWFSEGVFWIKMGSPIWKNELTMAKSRIKDTLNKELGAKLIEEVKVI